MTKGSEEDVTFTQKLQSRIEAQQCVSESHSQGWLGIIILGLSLIWQMSVSIITKIQPGSRKLYIKYFLMSTEGFFSLLLWDIYTSRMPQLEATLKIYEQYFFDICHTHFRTVLSENILMNHLLKNYLILQRDGDNGNLTVFLDLLHWWNQAICWEKSKHP